MQNIKMIVAVDNRLLLQKNLQNACTYTIGRAVGKDILIDATTVSSLHAVLTIDLEGNIFIEDMGSSNGTFVKGVALAKGKRTKITLAEPIYFGKSVEVVFQKVDISAPVAPVVPESQNYAQSQEKSILMSAGIQNALNLNKERITIGREENNDIVLRHPTVSRLHTQIVKKGTQFFIKDMGSMNGTFVNGEKITREVALRENDVVYISGHKLRFDWGSMTVAQESDTGGVNVSVNNLIKDVPIGGSATKRLLSNISFNVKPREFVAVLGVSGAGKSTLVDALCGFRKATGGTVMFNGTELYNNYEQFKPLIGYVPQADIVHTELTVKEVLTFAAKLRLPPETSSAELQKLITEVIQDLELVGRENIQVGRLSGGQRKRVSIGVELLTKPTVFFLDEPSSGLDPGMEKNLMMRMRKLAEKGSTIFLITHATLNVDLCDKIVFLAKDGHLAFFGTPNEARTYFKDVFGTDDFADIYLKIEQEKQPQRLSDRFRQSVEYKKYAANNVASRSVEPQKVFPQVRVSSFKQWIALTHRYALTFWKDKTNLAILLFQSAIVAMIIVGTLHYDIGDDNAGIYREVPQREEVKVTQADIERMQVPGTNAVDPEKMGTYIKEKIEDAIDTVDDVMLRSTNMSTVIAMLVYTVILLGAFNACREIVKEIPIYKRERLVNLKILPYVMSKVVVLMLIFLVQAFLLVLIVSKGLGMPNFLMTFVAYYVLYVASMMLGLMISAAVKKVDQAVSIVVVVLICQIIFSGALFPEDNIKPKALRYLFWPAVSKWSYELIGSEILDVNEKIKDDRFDLAAFKDKKDYPHRVNWIILTAWGIVVPFGATCLFLKRKDKEN